MLLDVLARANRRTGYLLKSNIIAISIINIIAIIIIAILALTIEMAA